MEKYEPLNNFFKNKRRHRRFAVDTMDIRILAKTASEKSAAADCRVTMLSLGGALMEDSRIYDLNSKLMIEMTLPYNVCISLTGRVTSCIPSKAKRGRHDVGIEFTPVSEKDGSKLKKFIHWLYLKEAGFTE